MIPKYDIALVVGRFQPYHNLHHKLINHALGLGKEVVIVLGSARSSPDIKNPFTPKDREAMIRSCFDEETNDRITFKPLRDYPYKENNWIAEIQNVVRNIQEDRMELPEGKDALHNIKLGETKVALVGHEKDQSSYYLKLFPQWTFESFYENTKESKEINATDIRAMYLEANNVTTVSKGAKWRMIEDLVPEPVAKFLKQFTETEQYEDLVKEWAYVQKYREDSKFKGLPFAPTFVTTDTVVTYKGHILVVKRGANPGKGKLALPGGFLAEGTTLRANAVKELREETRINISAALLDGLIKKSHVFDHPHRSQRGRTITHAFYIPITVKIEDTFPLVRGGDDAAKAFWMPIADLALNEDQFFEDHFHIANHFLGVQDYD